MKRTLLILFLLSSSWLMAQPNFNNVISALRSGDVASIGNNMTEQVELTIEGEHRSYAQAQALSVVAQFFEQNAPSNCSLVHHGAARDGASHYCIGSLTAGGKKYRAYIFFKKLNSSYKIQEMRITQE
jgi:hypothetical protein